MIEGIAKHYVARGQLYRQELTLDPRNRQIPAHAVITELK